MDSICLKDIEVWTHIGVPDAERTGSQLLLVSVELFGSLKGVSISDDISQGIDYTTVTSAVIALGTTERKTVERFAEDAAALILKTFKPESVKITVCKKPDLPLAAACITITRP